MPIHYSNIPVQTIYHPKADSLNITLQVLRLDQIHPVVSGNKLFKLQPYFSEFINGEKKINKVCTFGGAYSNHLVATAFYCNELKLPCTGFVRGETPAKFSPTLLECIELKMQLEFVSRTAYREKEQDLRTLQQRDLLLIIPEGGYGLPGAAGAADIYSLIPETATHIVCALGTGTTVAGLLRHIKSSQQIISVPVLKNMHEIESRLLALDAPFTNQNLIVWNNYHFGGYAKSTSELLNTMNMLYEKHNIPTDFVYTGKMMFGLFDQIENGYFKPGDHIVAIHSGGLQGNRSLPSGTLTF